jgi:hypothetical protein
MAFVTTQPETLAATAAILQGIGSAMERSECGCGGPNDGRGSRGRRRSAGAERGAFRRACGDVIKR